MCKHVYLTVSQSHGKSILAPSDPLTDAHDMFLFDYPEVCFFLKYLLYNPMNVDHGVVWAQENKYWQYLNHNIKEGQEFKSPRKNVECKLR